MTTASLTELLSSVEKDSKVLEKIDSGEERVTATTKGIENY